MVDILEASDLMSKQYCLINDAETGGAVIGTVSFGADLVARGTRVDDVKKQPNEKPANWHHPVSPTILHVVEGSHRIWVQNRGVAQSVEIVAGDHILFLDFETDGVVAAGAHPGHWSQQGKNGLVAERYVIDGEVDLATLGFAPLP